MSKKNRNIIILAVVILIILVIFHANSTSSLVRQLQGPVEGSETVLTVGDKLAVVSKNNNIYTWQWNNLSAWPIVSKPQTQLIMSFDDDKIVYLNSGKLILTDFKADTELASLFLPYGSDCEKLKISQNGRFGAASIVFNEGAQKGVFKLALFDSTFKELSFVFQKDIVQEEFSLYDFTLANDAAFLAGAGKKENAWLFVADVNSQSVKWEKTFDQYKSFTSIEISPDGKWLFAAEKIRHILMFDTENGQLLKTFVMDEYQTPSNQKQNISCIEISPDGKILAVDTEPAGQVWFWDIASGSQIGKFSASNLTVSDIAFSPDSKLLATGCLVSPEIKIWKVPQPKP